VTTETVFKTIMGNKMTDLGLNVTTFSICFTWYTYEQWDQPTALEVIPITVILFFFIFKEMMYRIHCTLWLLQLLIFALLLVTSAAVLGFRNLLKLVKIWTLRLCIHYPIAIFCEYECITIPKCLKNSTIIDDN
jgi:hypothetical protein